MSDITIVAILAMIGPVILSQLTAWQRKAERKEEWAHQKLLLDAQTAAIIEPIEAVHKVVNSSATALAQQNAQVLAIRDATIAKQEGVVETLHNQIAAIDNPMPIPTTPDKKEN